MTVEPSLIDSLACAWSRAARCGWAAAWRGMGVAVVLLLSATAHGQALDCEPMDSVAFGTLVYDAQEAIDRAEPEIHESIVKELRANLSCLSFAPTQRQWANYLVIEALLEFLQGGDWQSPITAARSLWPTVDLQVGSRHPLAQHEGEHEVGEGIAVTDITLFVDGVRTETLPTAGLHLVQRQEGDRWRTVLMRGDPIDLAALQAPFPRQPVRRWAFELNGVVGGGGGVQRRVDWPSEPSGGAPVIPEEGWVSAWPAITARGVVSQDRLAAGIHLDLGLPRLSNAQLDAGEVFVGLAWAGGTVLGLGPGVGSSGLQERSTVDGTLEYRSLPRVYGALVLETRSPRLDGGLTAGLGNGVAKLALFGGLCRSSEPGAGPLRLGLSSDLIASRFAQPTLPDGSPGGQLWSLGWRAGVEVGIARRPAG